MTVNIKTTPIPPNPADWTPEATKQLLKANIYDRYLAYSIVKELILDWEFTKAYKVGLVDKQGNKLKRRDELSPSDKKQFTMFDNVITNIKRIILRYHRISLYSWAHALRLIREDINAGEEGNMDVYIRAITEMVMHEQTLLEEMGAGAVSGSAPSVTTASTGVQDHIVVKHKTGAIFRRGPKKKKKKNGKVTEEYVSDWHIQQYAKQNPTHYIIVQEDNGKRTFVRYGK